MKPGSGRGCWSGVSPSFTSSFLLSRFISVTFNISWESRATCLDNEARVWTPLAARPHLDHKTLVAPLILVPAEEERREATQLPTPTRHIPRPPPRQRPARLVLRRGNKRHDTRPRRVAAVKGCAASLHPRVWDHGVCEGQILRERGKEGGIDEQTAVSMWDGGSSPLAPLEGFGEVGAAGLDVLRCRGRVGVRTRRTAEEGEVGGDVGLAVGQCCSHGA